MLEFLNESQLLIAIVMHWYTWIYQFGSQYAEMLFYGFSSDMYITVHKSDKKYVYESWATFCQDHQNTIRDTNKETDQSTVTPEISADCD